MDLYVKSVATKLGVSEYYWNTDLTWDTNGNLVDMDYKVNQSEFKFIQFQEFTKEHNLNNNDCVVVGDSDNDVILFKRVKGISVNSNLHSELDFLAFKNITNLLELKEII